MFFHPNHPQPGPGQVFKIDKHTFGEKHNKGDRWMSIGCTPNVPLLRAYTGISHYGYVGRGTLYIQLSPDSQRYQKVPNIQQFTKQITA